MTGLELHPGRGQDGFVTRPADLKEDQTLILELDLLVVDLS
jgi:hypothetical protein